MPRAAYCSECGDYSWVGKDGGCAVGHPRSGLRAEYDASQDVATGAPVPPVVVGAPVTPTNAKEALAALGRGTRSYVGALGQHLESKAGLLRDEDSASHSSLVPSEPSQPVETLKPSAEGFRTPIAGKSRMSRSRRIVLITAGCLLFLTVLVPPWNWVGGSKAVARASAGYGLLFAPPTQQESFGDGTLYTSTAQAIDLSRLGLQALLIVLGAGIVWFALPQKPPTN